MSPEARGGCRLAHLPQRRAVGHRGSSERALGAAAAAAAAGSRPAAVGRHQAQWQRRGGAGVARSRGLCQQATQQRRGTARCGSSNEYATGALGRVVATRRQQRGAARHGCHSVVAPGAPGRALGARSRLVSEALPGLAAAMWVRRLLWGEPAGPAAALGWKKQRHWFQKRQGGTSVRLAVGVAAAARNLGGAGAVGSAGVWGWGHQRLGGGGSGGVGSAAGGAVVEGVAAAVMRGNSRAQRRTGGRVAVRRPKSADMRTIAVVIARLAAKMGVAQRRARRIGGRESQARVGVHEGLLLGFCARIKERAGGSFTSLKEFWESHAIRPSEREWPSPAIS